MADKKLEISVSLDLVMDSEYIYIYVVKWWDCWIFYQNDRGECTIRNFVDWSFYPPGNSSIIKWFHSIFCYSYVHGSPNYHCKPCLPFL